MGTMGRVAIAIVAIVILRWGWKLLNWVWLKPKKLERWLRDVGYKGNPYKLLIGDLIDLATMVKEGKSKPIPVTHDIASYALPFEHHIISKYGDMEGVHSYVEGICERDGLVGVVEDDMEGVHSSQFLGKNGEEWPNGEKSFIWMGPKPSMYIRDPELIKEILLRSDEFRKPHPEAFRDSLIGGILVAEGHKWIKHRKIINPAFNLQNLKVCVEDVLLLSPNKKFRHNSPFKYIIFI
ncbi:putative secologanin synthase [Helianthus anomalus]